MTRHLFKLVWNRKRTNLLVMLEISVRVPGAVRRGRSRRLLPGQLAPARRASRGTQVWDVEVDNKRVRPTTRGRSDRASRRRAGSHRAAGSSASVDAASACAAPGALRTAGGDGRRADDFRGRPRSSTGRTRSTDAYKDVLRPAPSSEGGWFSPTTTARTTIRSRSPSACATTCSAAVARSVVLADGEAGLTPRRDEHRRPGRRPVGEPAARRRPASPEAAPHRRRRRDVPRGRRVRRSSGTSSSYRKDVGPRRRADATGRPGTCWSRVRPGTTAEFEETLVRTLQAGRARLVVRGAHAARRCASRRCASRCCRSRPSAFVAAFAAR